MEVVIEQKRVYFISDKGETIDFCHLSNPEDFTPVIQPNNRNTDEKAS